MTQDYQLHTGVSPVLSALWRNPEAFAFNLLVTFLDVFGMDAVEWSPETIEMELRDELGVDPLPINFDKLLTAISLLTTNSFFVSLPDFMRDCTTLSGTFTSEGSMVMPDSEDIAWGITEALLISPPDKEEKLNDEIIGFIIAVLDDEGIQNPPDILRIVNADRKFANQVDYQFSDDVTMFAAIQQTEKDRTDNINRTMQSRSRGLLEQLKSLPLKHGKSEIAAKLLAKLTARTE